MKPKFSCFFFVSKACKTHLLAEQKNDKFEGIEPMTSKIEDANGQKMILKTFFYGPNFQPKKFLRFGCFGINFPGYVQIGFIRLTSWPSEMMDCSPTLLQISIFLKLINNDK